MLDLATGSYRPEAVPQSAEAKDCSAAIAADFGRDLDRTDGTRSSRWPDSTQKGRLAQVRPRYLFWMRRE